MIIVDFEPVRVSRNGCDVCAKNEAVVGKDNQSFVVMMVLPTEIKDKSQGGDHLVRRFEALSKHLLLQST
jgi:hypothetical protein